jgi:hypothetical protein
MFANAKAAGQKDRSETYSRVTRVGAMSTPDQLMENS